MHQVRCVLAKQSAFAERLEHEARCFLASNSGTPPCTTFCAATRCPFGKISLFNQQGAVSPGSRIDCDSKAGCSSANDEEIPRFVSILDSIERFVAFHKVVNEFLRIIPWCGLATEGTKKVRPRSPGWVQSDRILSRLGLGEQIVNEDQQVYRFARILSHSDKPRSR